VSAVHGAPPSPAQRVNQQDFDADERCRPAMSSRGYADGVLVPSEHHIGAFHDWIRGLPGEPAPM
jgi:hypothetical protein